MTTRYAVRLFTLSGEFFETVAVDFSEAEAIAYASTYNAIETGKVACIASYPLGSDPAAIPAEMEVAQ